MTPAFQEITLPLVVTGYNASLPDKSIFRVEQGTLTGVIALAVILSDCLG